MYNLTHLEILDDLQHFIAHSNSQQRQINSVNVLSNELKHIVETE